jgi:hypothetical protein
MIIKKWSGSAWVAQNPRTTAQQVFNAGLTEAVFDTNSKLKVGYLPDVVVGGMNFAGTISLATDQDGAALYAAGLVDVGDYLIVTNAGNIVAGGSIQALAVQAPGDEGDSTLPVTLEAGDWIVLTDKSGSSPQTLTVAIVNNTYQTATTSAYGIARLSNATTYAGLSGNDVVTEGVLKTTIDNASFASSSHTHTLANITDVTATAAEVNVLDGITSTTAELNKLDGFTGGSLDLNYAKDLRATGVTSTEFDYLDGVTSNIQTQLNAKQATITGAATSITSSDLTVSRALVSDGSGKVAVSAVTSTELGYLDGVTSSIQTQLNGKQATITGAATTIDTENLTANRAVVSDGSGKVAVSLVTSTELGYLSGVSSNIQTQLDGKEDPLTAGSGIGRTGDTLSVGGGEGISAETNSVRMTYPLYVQTSTPTTLVPNAIWYDIN